MPESTNSAHLDSNYLFNENWNLSTFLSSPLWSRSSLKDRQHIFQHKMIPTNTFNLLTSNNYAFTQPLLPQAGYDTRSIFRQSKAELNSEFSFSKTSCLTMTIKSSLPYYLPIAEGRTDGFMPIPRVLVQNERQRAVFRIWTQVADFISYDNNLYTKHTSKNIKQEVHLFY